VKEQDSHIGLRAFAGVPSWHTAAGGPLLAMAGIGLASVGTFLIAVCWMETVPWAEALAMALLAGVISAPLQFILWAATVRWAGWPRLMTVLGAAVLASGIPLGWALRQCSPSRVFEQEIMYLPDGVRVLRAWEDPTRCTWAHLATQPAALKEVLAYLECPRPCGVQNTTALGAPPWWKPLSMKGPTLYRHDVVLATRLVWVNEARTEAYVAILRPGIP
jgi:hypothetical protein